MKTKTVRALGALFLLTAFNSGLWADIPLQDIKEIQGKWLLEAVAPGLTKPKIEENRTWEFRADGVVVTSGYNRHLKQDDSQQFKFSIADGKIRAEDPGRPGKTMDYSVYERNGDALILKGGIEGFYFFKKK